MDLFRRKEKKRYKERKEKAEKERKVKLEKKEVLLKKKPLEIMKQLIEENSECEFADDPDYDQLQTPSIGKKEYEYGCDILFDEALKYHKIGKEFGNRFRYVQSLAKIHDAIDSIPYFPNYPPTDNELSTMWHTAGLVVADMGEFAEISDVFFKKAMDVSPNWESLYEIGLQLQRSWLFDHDKGEKVWEQGKLAEAIEYFDKALAIAPEQFEVWIAKIESLQELKNYEKANSCCDELIQSYLFTANGVDYEITLLEYVGEYINKEKIRDEAVGNFADYEDVTEQLCMNEEWERIVSTIGTTRDTSFADLHSTIHQLFFNPQKIKIDDDEYVRKQKLSDFWFQKGRILFDLEKYGESLICIKTSIILDNERNEIPWALASQIYEKFKAKEQAQKCDENSKLTWCHWDIYMPDELQFGG
jgi:tetratricopeptide (TPR) repeat protein